MRAVFDKQRRRFAVKDERSIRRSFFDLLDGFLFPAATRTTTAPFVRDTISVQRLLNNFVIASLPVWVIGLWSVGKQTNRAIQILGIDSPEGWRADLLQWLGVGFSPFNIGGCFLHGFLYFLPIFLIALIVGAFWESMFAKYRGRPVDDGLLQVAWLFALILPATVSPLEVALGMTAAIVVGKGIFGGSGRYLVSPAIFGLAFLTFSYPNVLFGPGSWVPVAGFDDTTPIELFTDENGIETLLSVGYSWTSMFIGDQPGPFGVVSILGCLLGAIYLVLTGTASWRIMVGSFIGLVVTVLVFNAFGGEDNHIASIPWYWHAITGGWAFGTVFLATDPVASSYTNPGRCL